MQVFAVGGAVRDELLGLPVKDRDYVVVGATPDEMIAQGFRPVGRDFPVFLHPETGEEYALARTERKSGHGYHGFTFHAAPEVTLDEDLARRDLTVNAMARAADGTLIDPFGGRIDLAAKRLRHVGPSFVEDPVRLLRVARFAARFPDFAIADETFSLLRTMVRNGEVDHLVAERVWQELAGGLRSARPDRMFAVLADCGALARLLPELDALRGVAQRPDAHPEGDAWQHTLAVLAAAAAAGLTLAECWAALLHDIGKGATPMAQWPQHAGHEERGAALAAALSERLRAPADCRDLAVLAARWHGALHRLGAAPTPEAGSIVEVLERTDAFRRPARFARLLSVAEADHAGSGSGPYRQRLRWETALRAAQQIDPAQVAGDARGAEIGARMRAARLAAVADALARSA